MNLTRCVSSIIVTFVKGIAMSNETKLFQVMTPEDLRVIEMAARRAQAEEMLRLVRLAATNVKAFFARAAAAIRIRRAGTAARHGA